MGAAFAPLLPLAITVALTMVPIAGTIVVLLGAPTARRGWMIVSGYAVGLALVVIIATLLVGGVTVSSGRSEVVPVAEIVVGVGLIAYSVVHFVRRRRRRARGEAPRRAHSALLTRMEKITPWQAAAVGFSFALHPENILLCAAAAARLVDHRLDPLQLVAGLVFFVAVGVSTVVAPTVIYAVGAERVRPSPRRAEDWLLANSSIVMAVLLLGVGLALVALGVWHLITRT